MELKQNDQKRASEGKFKDDVFALPIELPTWFIKLFTKEKDVVLDPFLGSGTTAVVALLHKRKYIGIELKTEYFNEAQKNINEVKKIMNKKS